MPEVTAEVSAGAKCPKCKGWQLYGGERCDDCRGTGLALQQEPCFKCRGTGVIPGSISALDQRCDCKQQEQAARF